MRHRRRRFGDVQRFHCRGVRGGRRGRARGKARQPLDQLAMRLGGRAGASGRAHRSAAGTRGARDRRGGHRIFVRAGHAHGDAACHAGAARTAHAHGLQSSRTADESRRGVGAGGGRLRRELHGTDGARARRTRRAARVRGAWRGWPGRDFHRRRNLRRRIARRCGAQLYGDARGFRLAPRAARSDSRRRRQAQRGNHPQNLRPSLLYREHGPHREIVLANAAAALVAAGRAADFLDGVRLAAKSIDSGAAREKLEALVAFSQAEKGASHTAS